MAMDPNAMADLIESFMPPLDAADARAARKKGILAFAKGIIGHLTSAAQISGVVLPGLATPPGGGAVAGTAILPPGSIL